MNSFCDAFNEHHTNYDDHWLSINLSYFLIENKIEINMNQIIDLGNYLKDCLWCHMPLYNTKIVYLSEIKKWYDTQTEINSTHFKKYLIEKINIWKEN